MRRADRTNEADVAQSSWRWRVSPRAAKIWLGSESVGSPPSDWLMVPMVVWLAHHAFGKNMVLITAAFFYSLARMNTTRRSHCCLPVVRPAALSSLQSPKIQSRTAADKSQTLMAVKQEPGTFFLRLSASMPKQSSWIHPSRHKETWLNVIRTKPWKRFNFHHLQHLFQWQWRRPLIPMQHLSKGSDLGPIP